MSQLITDEFGFISSQELQVPRGRKNLSPIRLDLTDVSRAESRISEIARATPIMLPDLITCYTVGLASLAKVIAIVEMESKVAKMELETAEATFTLDFAEGVLAKKGIKSSVDARQHACRLDPAVREFQEKLDILSTTLTYLYNKKSAIEMAYHGCKKVCDVYLKQPGGPVYGGGNGEE